MPPRDSMPIASSIVAIPARGAIGPLFSPPFAVIVGHDAQLPEGAWRQEKAGQPTKKNHSPEFTHHLRPSPGNCPRLL